MASTATRNIKLLTKTASRGLATHASSSSHSHSHASLSPHAHAAAEKLSKNWKGTSATGGTTKNFINGEFVESTSEKWLDVTDPSNQTVLSKVPETTDAEFERAVGAAEEAFKTWSRTSILTRQKVAME